MTLFELLAAEKYIKETVYDIKATNVHIYIYAHPLLLKLSVFLDCTSEKVGPGGGSIYVYIYICIYRPCSTHLHQTTAPLS